MSEIIFQPRAKKTWLHSLTTSVLVALVVSLFGAVGVVRAVNADLDTVKREEIATTALSPADAEFENYLFVESTTGSFYTYYFPFCSALETIYY